jgi:hypothetical protein
MAIGEDLILTTTPDGSLVLHFISDDLSAHPLGTFDSVVEAWEAVDAIDTAFLSAEAA